MRSIFVGIFLFSSMNLYAETNCRCTPRDKCWPNADFWNELRHQLKGELIKPSAEIEICLKNSSDKSCVQVLNNLHNPYQIENNPGNTQSQGWMNAWQNQASVYAVAAANANDVATAIQFARKHHLRVVIKGTGHDYLGRSNAKDSLLIWTHHLRDITFNEAFIPTGCVDGKKGESALTVGAGTRWLEAYDAATNQHHRYIQGGGCATVGAAGGFIQGGGFGSFSKNFGTGAAGILEAEIVTADGKIRIANRCQNEDLFWAVRGGGGGTYGVVTKLTLKTHALPKTFGIYQATITASSDAAYKKLISEILSFYHANLNNAHWGEQISFEQDNRVSLFLTFQNLDNTQAQNTFSPLRNWIKQHTGQYTFNQKATLIPGEKLWDYNYLSKNIPWLPTLYKSSDHQKLFWWTPNTHEVSAYWYTYQSWWLPISLFVGDKKTDLADTIFNASRLSTTTLHINKGLAGASESVRQAVKETATNPTVLDAAALVIMSAGSNQTYPGVKGKEPDYKKGKIVSAKISKAMSYFKTLAPNAGSYVNETDYFLPDWQKALWGENYTKLLAIKKKYDPDGLFYCHHCVGSEEWSPDGMCKIAKRES